MLSSSIYKLSNGVVYRKRHHNNYPFLYGTRHIPGDQWHYHCLLLLVSWHRYTTITHYTATSRYNTNNSNHNRTCHSAGYCWMTDCHIFKSRYCNSFKGRSRPQHIEITCNILNTSRYQDSSPAQQWWPGDRPYFLQRNRSRNPIAHLGCLSRLHIEKVSFASWKGDPVLHL